MHTHMTNTRITDPEILERRYECFKIAVRFHYFWTPTNLTVNTLKLTLRFYHGVISPNVENGIANS